MRIAFLFLFYLKNWIYSAIEFVYCTKTVYSIERKDLYGSKVKGYFVWNNSMVIDSDHSHSSTSFGGCYSALENRDFGSSHGVLQFDLHRFRWRNCRIWRWSRGETTRIDQRYHVLNNIFDLHPFYGVLCIGPCGFCISSSAEMGDLSGDFGSYGNVFSQSQKRVKKYHF